MGKSRIPGNRPKIGGSPADVRQGDRTKQAGHSRPVEKIAQDRLDPDEIPVPEIQEGFSAQKTGLQGVVEAGLTRLASAHGFTAQDNALGVLVKAMASAAGPAVEPPEAYAGILQGELRQALSTANADVSPAVLRQDATQLLTLAAAALGGEGLPTNRDKADAVLAADIRVIKDALADVLRQADASTVKRLQDTQEGISWAANVLSKGQPALEKADATASTRMEALAGVLRIVLKYAQQGA